MIEANKKEKKKKKKRKLTNLIENLSDGKGGYFTVSMFGVHYENTPIQVYRKFHLQNLKIFR